LPPQEFRITGIQDIQLTNLETGETIATSGSISGESLTFQGRPITNSDSTTDTINSFSIGGNISTEQYAEAFRRMASNTRMCSYDAARGTNSSRPQEAQNHKNYINSFNYNPEQFHFHKVNTEEELYMGVELEIDGGKGESNNIAAQCIKMLGENNIYCKHDGSLQSGFEIVTHPCTYKYHKKLSYQNLFEFLVKEDYKSHNTSTCGLHVHFNKNYFGKDKLHQDLNIGKLLYILEKFWEKVVLVARRDSNRFSRRFNINEDETILDMYAKSKNSDKYGAVNLQHKNSFEIRIFKGTLNYDTFINTLEFVDKIVKYIRQIDIYEIQMITWDDISANFSDKLNEYIADREEKEKNKPKPKSITEQILRGRGGSFVPYDSYMGFSTGRSIGYDGCGMVVNNVPSMLEDLSNAIFTCSSDRSRSNLVSDEETTLKRRIQDLRQQERRERNHMAQTNIRREISELERRLAMVRRNSRRRQSNVESEA